MSEQEQRLAEYLKRAVPEPPVWLSPEEITMQQADRPRRSWAMPVLAAAVVVAIGVTIGAVATHHPTTRPPAASSVADQSGTGPAGAASAHATPSCQAHGASVTAPNVVGMSVAQAELTLAQAGFVSVIRVSSSTAPTGTVIGQSPAPGTQLARGAAIELTATGKTPKMAHLPPGPAVPPDCPASAEPSAVPSGKGATGPSAEPSAVPSGKAVAAVAVPA
ncbi:MAG: hypothetical protein JWM19_1724 [Actinomycetia bacterium]|nr:hypothetical protein [Actinomycetes bacterium]